MRRENPIKVFFSIIIGLGLGIAVFIGGYVMIQQASIRCAPGCAEESFNRLSLYRPFPEGQPESRDYLLSLNDTDFTSSDFTLADFRGISMNNCIFDEADLTAVNFADTSLTRASFINATMAGGRFTRADLREANFTGADLSTADLRSAQLYGADFTDANLFGIRLEGAVYDQATIWPFGFDPRSAGAILVENSDL